MLDAVRCVNTLAGEFIMWDVHVAHYKQQHLYSKQEVQVKFSNYSFLHNTLVLSKSINRKQNSQTTSCNINEIRQKVNMVCINLIFVCFPVKDYS